MPKVFLPNYGGYAHYHIPTREEFDLVKGWGLLKDPFDAAIAFMSLDKIDGMTIPSSTKATYPGLRNLMLAIAPDDEGVIVESVLQATARHYAKH
jgi:hypothetical protein